MATAIFRPPIRQGSVPAVPAMKMQKSSGNLSNASTAASSPATSPSNSTAGLHGKARKSLAGHRSSGSQLDLVRHSQPEWFEPNKDANLGDAITSWEQLCKTSVTKKDPCFAVFTWTKRFEKLEVCKAGGHSDDSSHHECMLVSADLCAKNEPHWCSYTVRVVHNDKSGQRLDEMVPIGFFVCPKDASPMKKAQCKALKQRIRNTVFKNCQLFFDHMQEPINASDEQFVEHVLKQATTVFSNVENNGENNSSVNGRLFFKSAKAGSQNFKYLDFGGGHKYSAAAPFRKTINDELEVSYDNMQRKLMQRLALHLMDEEKASRVSQQKADEEMAEELREIDQNKVALQCWSEQNRRIKEFGTGKVNKVFGKAASAECLEKAMHSQTFMRSFEERHRRYGQQHAKELLDQEQLERVAKLQLIDKMQEQLRQEKQTLVKRILDAEQKRRMSTKDEKVLQEEYSKAKMAKAISHAISHELEQSASQMERKSHRRSHAALLTEEHARRLEDVPLPSQEHINTMQPVLRSIRSEVVHKE